MRMDKDKAKSRDYRADAIMESNTIDRAEYSLTRQKHHVSHTLSFRQETQVSRRYSIESPSSPKALPVSEYHRQLK